MAFLPTLFVIAVAASSAVGLPYFEGYYQPAYYYPNLRYSRSAPSTSSSGAGASSYAGSSASSSTGTQVAPGPGGSGAFNAFAGTGHTNEFGPPPAFGAPPGFGGPGQAGYGYGYGSFPPGFSFPSFDFNTFFQQYYQNFQEAQRRAQEAAASGTGSNEVGATASGEYSPGGGYGSANVFPGAPQGMDFNFGGPDNRFGGGAEPVNSVSGSFPPPGSNHFGVFTSTSSQSSNVDGKTTSHKMATVGINDNGKVTTYTAHDP